MNQIEHIMAFADEYAAQRQRTNIYNVHTIEARQALRTAIEQALATPEESSGVQEPVATKTEQGITLHVGWDDLHTGTKLYQSPQIQEPQEPVYWEWRWFDESPYTVTSGQWSEWKRVQPRSALQTLDDALNEFRAYITRGNRYELRALYAAPQPQPKQEPYDQQSLELCEVCGWKTLIPGDGCLNCERKPQPQPKQVLVNPTNLTDLNYHQLWQVWSTNKELIKWAFPIYSYTPIEGGIKYALEYDAQTTHKTIDALAKEGYRCSIVERLLKGESVGYDHGPQAATLAEAERDVRKWLNERPNRPLDLRHVAMLAYHAQQSIEAPKPKREWVGLSDSDLADYPTDEYEETARYWEAKLRNKNS